MNSRKETALLAGASGNVGRGLALHLAHSYGWNLILHGRRVRKDATEFNQHLRDLGCDVRWIYSDLSTPRGLQNLVNTVGKLHPNLRCLVYLASSFPMQDWTQISWNDFQHLTHLHTWAPFALVRDLKDMFSPPARVIFFSDAGHPYGYPRYAGYTMSRYSLHALARWLARVLAPYITIHVIAPYFIESTLEHRKPPHQLLVHPTSIQDIVSLVSWLIDHGDSSTGRIFTLDSGRFL